MVLSQKTGNEILNFYYDSAGQVMSIGYKAPANAVETVHFVSRNAQGDISAIYLYNTTAKTSTVVGTYTYDAWGKVTTTVSSDPNGIMTKTRSDTEVITTIKRPAGTIFRADTMIRK